MHFVQDRVRFLHVNILARLVPEMTSSRLHLQSNLFVGSIANLFRKFIAIINKLLSGNDEKLAFQKSKVYQHFSGSRHLTHFRCTD